jgi:predicted ATPase
MLKKVTLLRNKIEDWSEYPLSVPTIESLTELNITSRICFFVGENGSGKSTLLEAIAEKYGFSKEGGDRNMVYDPTYEIASSASYLSNFLRLSWAKKIQSGYFLRAESFFNVATYLDKLQKEEKLTLDRFHEQSHGESFLAVFQKRVSSNGFYLLDEPEAALSPQRQLSFLAIIHDTIRDFNESQFIIVTHSPIILAYPEAQIFSFNNSRIEEVEYKQTEVYKITHGFLSNPESYLRHLFT